MVMPFHHVYKLYIAVAVAVITCTVESLSLIPQRQRSDTSLEWLDYDSPLILP
jgi:hypothetical protein